MRPFFIGRAFAPSAQGCRSLDLPLQFAFRPLDPLDDLGIGANGPRRHDARRDQDDRLGRAAGGLAVREQLP